MKIGPVPEKHRLSKSQMKKMEKAMNMQISKERGAAGTEKAVSMADLLDVKAVTKSYRKATIVVHPDRTGNLDHEKRFIAKRIFDALTQAKTEFDAENG